jgi:hypothetical protein
MIRRTVTMFEVDCLKIIWQKILESFFLFMFLLFLLFSRERITIVCVAAEKRTRRRKDVKLRSQDNTRSERGIMSHA